MDNNFCEEDMKFLAEQGFNTLRVPMHYKYFTLPIEKEPVADEQTWVQEGFDRIAALFKMVGEIEKHHEERYKKLLANIEGGLVFSRDNDMVWQCSNCGHIVVGKSAPEVCPVCEHPQAYFQVKAENY